MADFFGFSRYDVVPGGTDEFVQGLVTAYEANNRQLRAMGLVLSSDAMHQVFDGEVDFEASKPTQF